MSTHRHIDAICIAVLLFTLAVTVLFMHGEALGLQVIVDEDAEDYTGTAYFTENDQNGDWSTAGATRITLRGDHVSVSGGGAYAYDGNVMITSGGRFAVSGTLDNGSIIVDANNSAKVWIMLDGAEISCLDAACIDIEQADKVFLTLAAGTENSVTTLGFSEAAEAAGMDGTIFARDDLSINGSGSLHVTAATAHGITANDELVITGGRIDVTAELDALHANDGLRLMAADLELTAGDDGISVTGPESEYYMESGTVTIKAADNGISAGYCISLYGGSLTVDAGNDGISASGAVVMTDSELNITAEDDGIHSDTAVAISGGSIQIPSCYEGIEAVTINVTGGDIVIYPEDDGMNANGGIDASGGFGGFNGGMPSGGMAPPDATDGAVPPEPPEGWEKPEDLQLPEGLELPEPTAMPEGQESPFGEGLPEIPGKPELAAASAGSEENGEVKVNTVGTEETWIHISGGSITIVNDLARDSDGLDSNGDIIISGGTVRVSLVNSGSNSALDYGSENGGVMEISGGSVIACGSYSMAEGFDASSSQCSILYNIKRGAPAGTTVSLENRVGKILLNYEVPCSFSSVILSCPEMQLGDTYTVVIGDSAEEITLDEVSASFGDAESERFSGPMNWGGMKFRPPGD